jgi:hypothetical protein
MCCMPATRTQVYLTAEQRRLVDALAEAEGVSLAEIVRRALDAYLIDVHVDPSEAIAATFGADPDAQHPDRGEWAHA